MITYFLQTSFCWLFFIMVYKLFLKKETFFVNNRLYLLSTLIIGLLFPFVRDLWDSNSSAPLAYVMPLQGSAQIFELNRVDIKKGIDFLQIIQIVFWLGFITSLGKLLKETYSILSQIRRYPNIKFNSYTQIKTDNDHLPFSFFNYVFISDQLKFKDPEWNRILTHEISHVHGWHSLDILFVEVLSTVFWWNPLIYWYRKNIRDTHEYIADAQVLKSTDTEAYGLLLVGSAQSGFQLSLANHFIYSQLKNRIDMMLKNKSKKLMIWKYALILPAILILVVLFAYKTSETFPARDFKMIPSRDSLPENVLYVLNGTKVKIEEIRNIIPDQITSMNVIKNKLALEKYGDEGQNGVVEIFTKTKYFIDGKEITKEEIEKVDPAEIGSTDIVKYGEEIGLFRITTKNKIRIEQNTDHSLHETFKVVEDMPRFPGCENLANLEEKKKCADEKMLQFLYKNISYPKEAKAKGIQGNVVISFVIEPDGTVGESSIVKEIGEGCGAEALRVINLMNSIPEKWIPGKQNGKAVAVQYNIPMAFRLENGSIPATKESTENDVTKVLVTSLTPPANQRRDVVKSTENKLSLIPNPANKKVDILYHQAKNVKIEIIDFTGRLMHQSSWDNFGGRQSIDISKLSTGSYIVRVQEGSNVSEQKLVVQ